MPHAEKDTVNGDMTHLTNGEKPQSKVLSVRIHPILRLLHSRLYHTRPSYIVVVLTRLQHLQTYPVINDSFELYKSHPYGAKSLSLLHQTYNSFVAPLHPYLQTPYSYLSPYLSRADELGDASLSKVDTRFPIVKEDTSKLKETVSRYVGLPFQLAGKGREYVLGTWQDEYRKTKGNDGSVVKNVKALLSTEIKIGMDSYAMLVQYWKKGNKEVNKKANKVSDIYCTVPSVRVPCVTPERAMQRPQFPAYGADRNMQMVTNCPQVKQ